MVAVVGFVILLEQALEHYSVITTPGLEDLPFPAVRLVLPALAVYMLVVWRMLRRETLATLDAVRPAIRVDDETYDGFVEDMLKARDTTYLALVALSVWIVIVLYMVFRNPFPVSNRVFLPANRLMAIFFVLAYVLVGWLGLGLSYTAFKHGRGMGRLAHCPLALNALDTTNVLPFGRHSLYHSASLAGVIIVLLLSLGQPTALIDYFVIMLAAGGSLSHPDLALMGRAHPDDQGQTGGIEPHLRSTRGRHRAFMKEDRPTNEDLDEITHRTDKLTQIRGQVLKMPNWPFRDATAIVRALFTATSPLVYLILTALIRDLPHPPAGKLRDRQIRRLPSPNDKSGERRDYSRSVCQPTASLVKPAEAVGY